MPTSADREMRAKRRYDIAKSLAALFTLLIVLASLLIAVGQNARITEIARDIRAEEQQNQAILKNLADLLSRQGETSEEARGRLREALTALDTRLDESDRNTVAAINDLIRAINRRNPNSEPIPLLDFPPSTEPRQNTQNGGASPTAEPRPSTAPSPAPSASPTPQPSPSPSPEPTCRVSNPYTGECLVRRIP